MQAVYACIISGEKPEQTYTSLLQELKDEVEEIEKRKKLSGDGKLLDTLYYDSMKNAERFDELIQQKAENWELERIALIDRILMHMAICEMLNFEDIPIKVTMNEYLELAKVYSTPKSSKFINGILDSIYNDFKKSGKIRKSGRGLIENSGSRPKPNKN